MGPKREPIGKGRLAVMATIIAGVGGLVTWILLPPPVDDTPPPLPIIEVAGQRVNTEGDAVADGMDLARRYAQQPLNLVLPDGETRELLPATLGLEIDRVRLSKFLVAALEEDSSLRRAHQRRLRADPAAVLLVPLPITIDTDQALVKLLGVKDLVDRAASNAVVDLEKRELKPERIGYRVDIYGTLARIDDALRSGRGEVKVAAATIEPRVKAAQLGNVKFDHVLGSFSTTYSQSARSRARTYNLRLAASHLDGTVLMPGEEFDFNDTVGPRDEANGYRVAPVIAQGELVDGIGGGTCQVSGTLHGAAFFAGLNVTARTPHSRPSTYIKLGMDAAVAYPTINFRMKNPFDFPVVLHEVVKGGRVEAQILGPYRSHTVTFFRRIDDVLPFDEVERENRRLPEGKRVLKQRGVPGFKLTVIRVVRDGPYAVRTKDHDVYPPTSQIVEVGTGPSNSESKQRHDRHPEYTADEYLVLSQDADGKVAESRFPGKTGREGWQEKAGMPVFKVPDDD